MVFIQDVRFQDFGSQIEIGGPEVRSRKYSERVVEPAMRVSDRDLFVSYRVTKMGLAGLPGVELRVWSGCARLELRAGSADLDIRAADLNLESDCEWKKTMARKSRNPNFDQMLEILRAHGFEVSPFAGVAGGMLVAKHGAAAVLVPAQGSQIQGGPVAYYERPGAFIGGEVARLVDRGYQKFLATSHFEIPASATMLQAIHLFGEELSQLIGGISLYNESLGTTSDLYQYDRLEGREAEKPVAAAPWALTEGH
jgi:hypothetical protein